jgi:hypothetical protein
MCLKRPAAAIVDVKWDLEKLTRQTGLGLSSFHVFMPLSKNTSVSHSRALVGHSDTGK